MANFAQHLNYGLATSSLACGVGYFQFELSQVECGAAFVIGVIGSLAPDFDHPASVPGGILFNWMGFLFPLAIYPYLTPYFDTDFRLEHWILLLAVGYLLIRHFSAYVLDKMTVHRGMFHSLPAVVIFGEVIYLGFLHLSFSSRVTIAAIAMIGYLTHLFADEFYSIDWKGEEIRVKKSYGTALDLGSFKQISTWVAYLTIALLAIPIWESLPRHLQPWQF